MSISHELSGNELISQLKFHKEVTTNRPKFNLYYPKESTNIEFSNNNLIIVDKGRSIGEKSIILIENEILLGFCFVDLEYQISNIEVLKSLIVPLENSLQNRFFVKNHLQKYKVEKIIRF